MIIIIRPLQKYQLKEINGKRTKNHVKYGTEINVLAKTEIPIKVNDRWILSSYENSRDTVNGKVGEPSKWKREKVTTTPTNTTKW